jgi:O-antigen/teichoic acid export membrane protein
MSAVVVPVTLLLVVAAPELWALLFPRSYVSGVFAFRCFTLIGIHRVTEYGIVLRAANRTAALVRLSALLLGLNAVLAVAGGLMWGGNGVAAGCLVAYLSSWIATVTVLGRLFGVPFRLAFPWRRWADAVGVALLATVVALALTSGMDADDGAGAMPKLAVKVVAFTAVVFGVRRVARPAPRSMAVVP